MTNKAIIGLWKFSFRNSNSTHFDCCPSKYMASYSEYTCSICFLQLKNQLSLKRHHGIHLKNDSSIRLACAVKSCHFTTKFNHHLNIHTKRSHPGLRPEVRLISTSTLDSNRTGTAAAITARTAMTAVSVSQVSESSIKIRAT